ncbi:hypothetical protein [Phaeobacter sp. C3_T13_0]|uniref:hypothetical protein n=1 Tax=Phaeobacter cretensis TaxID=3342641 RepID=UPI0039BC3595
MATHKNKTFCDDLQRRNGVEVLQSERQSVEAVLGSGAIKYKLNTAGLRDLFKSLTEDDTTQSGSQS